MVESYRYLLYKEYEEYHSKLDEVITQQTKDTDKFVQIFDMIMVKILIKEEDVGRCIEKYKNMLPKEDQQFFMEHVANYTYVDAIRKDLPVSELIVEMAAGSLLPHNPMRGRLFCSLAQLLLRKSNKTKAQ